MKQVIKQVLGIDVSKKELVVCLGRMYNDVQSELYAQGTFANTKTGFEKMISWTNKLTNPDISVGYVMEATGVYHESLAYFLKDRNLMVYIVLPNKISNYARSLTIKTVTDKTASQAITLFGLERHLEEWEKPLPVFKKLKQLTREREQIIVERTLVKNQFHAENSEAEPNKKSLTRIKKRIELLTKQEKEIMIEVAGLIKSDEKTERSARLLCSIPGIALLTAATVLAESNGFDLIKNKKQLVSYAGLDVKEKESGTSVKGTPKISKQGNRFLRKSMHLPSLTAIIRDEHFKAFYLRLVSKHGIKMKALVAVQRKLLELVYTLYKTNKEYDKNYFKTNISGSTGQLSGSN